MNYFDRAGRPCTFAEWAVLFADNQVLGTWVGQRFVNTIYLGIDHGFGGLLTIFESMVFPDCDRCVRYATEAEARAGHEVLVQELRAELAAAVQAGAA